MTHQKPIKIIILQKTALKLDKKQKVKNVKFPPFMSKTVIDP